MSKHTPGPWVVDDQSEQDIRRYILAGAAPANCAHVVASIRVPTANGPSLTEAEANARLIAAAPELLALVERLALLTDEGDDQIKGAAYIDNKHQVIRAKGSLLATIQQARELIAKATGEAA